MKSPAHKRLSKVMEVDFVAVSKSKRLICRQLTCGWIGVLMDCKSKRSTNRKMTACFFPILKEIEGRSGVECEDG
ncbi:hypothetical protein CEXT_547971 [Caerostris extrusa]|uniref:Uncharacterized protein n=1 Tax=Caerostris extrusa TaxID=172846 RepID=A0AAV4P010_CAEEX|nr:hypothetical protein CEXT_547971 [Caerostris extrusa]